MKRSKLTPLTPPGTDGLTRANYASCPIPQTHRRLVEAHLLWHQALDNYQEPEAFRANLNALIQALRNVTWILQSEKRTFAEFDAWYEPWQALMAEQRILRWLKDARNTVVKQGDLETESKAIVKLATWRDDVLLEASVPPDLPPDLLLRNFPLLELMRGVALPPGDLENAATIIERRWTVPGLPGTEILKSLAQAYGFLSDLVLDAHHRLVETSCIASGRSHDDFRSRHHPGGVLPCMALGSEQRTLRFDSSGAELQTVVSQAPVADRAVAAARYGLTEQDRSSAWEQLDPIPRARRVHYTAKRMLAKDKALQRIMFLRDGHGSWSALGLNARNKTEKHVLMRMVAKHIEAVGGDTLIDVGEAWTGAPTGDDVSAVDSSERAGRGEALYVFVERRR